jgi:predicted nucleic acid-binding protein
MYPEEAQEKPSAATAKLTSLKSWRVVLNDSINLLIMKLAGLKDIATNDADFCRVPWIKVWRP